MFCCRKTGRERLKIWKSMKREGGCARIPILTTPSPRVLPPAPVQWPKICLCNQGNCSGASSRTCAQKDPFFVPDGRGAPLSQVLPTTPVQGPKICPCSQDSCSGAGSRIRVQKDPFLVPDGRGAPSPQVLPTTPVQGPRICLCSRGNCSGAGSQTCVPREGKRLKIPESMKREGGCAQIPISTTPT